MIDKDWIGGAQNVMATLNSSNNTSKERAERDYYATPKKAVEELLRIHPFPPLVPIWECAAGEGAISSVLEEAGLNVRSSDIIDRTGTMEVVDFLSPEVTSWVGTIVTNPPFAKATEFLEKALSIVEEGDEIIFFLRIQFLEGVKRRKLFETSPPKKVWVASRNLRCAKNGDFANATGNASTYCWFVWEKGYTGKPEIGWFN